MLHLESQNATSDLGSRESILNQEVQEEEEVEQHANESVLDVVDGDEGDMVYLEVKENEVMHGVDKQVRSVAKSLESSS